MRVFKTRTMKNENGYFVVNDTNVTELSKKVAKFLKNGCKTVGSITTNFSSDGATSYLQTMIEEANLDSETTIEKFRKVVELSKSKDDLERGYNYAKSKYNDLTTARRSDRIEFDSFKVLVDTENEKNKLEKELNSTKEQFDKYSKAVIEYMRQINTTSIHNFDKENTITLHNNELWIQPNR